MKNKPFTTEILTDITYALDRGEISYDRMVDKLNEIAERFYLREVNEFYAGATIKITECFHGHEFEIGELVTIVEKSIDDTWRCRNSKGIDWYITEEEGIIYEK